MKIDKALFIGREITKIIFQKESLDWLFVFNEDAFVRVSTPWRIIDTKQIRQASGDEGHIYGLPKPVNVAKNVMEMLKGKKIIDFNNDIITADLVFEFEGGIKIQTFGNSAGYEPWDIQFKNGDMYFATAGGKIYREKWDENKRIVIEE
ncbi:MAG: hypothetical protein HY811_02770 [Planctomycetes bacterium]|nr:hypothetical protein [Planctomycetota bacterium]